MSGDTSSASAAFLSVTSGDINFVALAIVQDVILNKESNRETPSVVNFSERMRLTGTDGAAKMGMAPANTVHSLKRLLGKAFKDPSLQAELPRLPFSVTEAPDGRCQVNVQVFGE